MKPILDACCGSRMFWFDKQNSDVVFNDIRNENHILCDGRTLNIHPDIQADFTNLPFPDDSFYLVVFDPPHLVHTGEESWLAKKYGVLPSGWKKLIKDGFCECLRCLKPNGTLVFKWSDEQIPFSEIKKLLPIKPLFGDQRGKTRWVVFMKLPDGWESTDA